MTNEEKFRLIIDYAEKNGYKGHLKHLPVPFSGSYTEQQLDDLLNKVLYQHAANIMREPAFCQAIWPEPEVTPVTWADWSTHKALMLQSDNPLDYLWEAIDV
jgi:hypothetical protein